MDYGDDYGDDQPIPMSPAGPVKQNQASPATINLIYMLAEKDQTSMTCEVLQCVILIKPNTSGMKYNWLDLIMTS